VAEATGVCVVSMPWVSVQRPQLSVGILVAAARRQGIACDALHPALDFAARIGAQPYEALANDRAQSAACEHVFAANLFGARAVRSDEFIDRCEAQPGAGRPPAGLLRHLRDEVVPPFIEDTVERLLERNPRVVGFSCTFNQALASLALARRLKDRAPDRLVVFGGASMQGAMGRAWAQAFPHWVDHVFTGEADGLFPRYLERVLQGQPVSDLPGIASGAAGGAPAPAACALDETPVPDFTDYFAEHERLLRCGRAVAPAEGIPFESSRGCWWGSKSPCVFCGLNAAGMHYRRKSATRVADELLEQSRRHGVVRFFAADNILAADASKDLLPRIASLGLDLDLFWEIKPVLRRDDIAALAQAGVRRIQPGVESFSERLLTLAAKGQSALHNVQTLKWAREFGIQTDYNILVGLAGETAADYRETLAVVRRIRHLPPPAGRALPVQIHRFSPYFEAPQRFGLGRLRPQQAYSHLIPEEILAPQRFAYFFESEVEDSASFGEFIDQLNGEIDAWRVHAGTVEARLGAGFVSVHRGIGGQELDREVLEPLASLALVLADAQIGERRLVEQCTAAFAALGQDVVARRIERLIEDGWLLAAGKRVVSLLPFARPHSSAELDAWSRQWFSREA